MWDDENLKEMFGESYTSYVDTDNAAIEAETKALRDARTAQLEYQASVEADKKAAMPDIPYTKQLSYNEYGGFIPPQYQAQRYDRNGVPLKPDGLTDDDWATQRLKDINEDLANKPDINILNYPNKKQQILDTYKLGASQMEVAKILADSERQMIKKGISQEDINTFYGRSAVDTQIARDMQLNDDVYFYASTYGKSEEDVRRRIEDARLIGSTAAVLMDDDYYKGLSKPIEEARNQSRSIIENAKNFWGNAVVAGNDMLRVRAPQMAAYGVLNMGADKQKDQKEWVAMQAMLEQSAWAPQMAAENAERKATGVKELSKAEWEDNRYTAFAQDILNFAARQEVLNDRLRADVMNGLNPNLIDKTGSAFGSAMTFMAVGYLTAGTAGALGATKAGAGIAATAVSGAFDALGEAGAVLHEQLKKGATVDQALSAANKVGITQYPIAALQHAFVWMGGGSSAVMKYVKEILAESGQETIQGVVSGMATGLKPDGSGAEYTWGDLFEAFPGFRKWWGAFQDEGIPAGISAALLGAGEFAMNLHGERGRQIVLNQRAYAKFADQVNQNLSNSVAQQNTQLLNNRMNSAEALDIGVLTGEEVAARRSITDDVPNTEAVNVRTPQGAELLIPNNNMPTIDDAVNRDAEVNDSLTDMPEAEDTTADRPVIPTEPIQTEEDITYGEPPLITAPDEALPDDGVVYGPQIMEAERIDALPEIFISFDEEDTVPTLEEEQAADEQAAIDAQTAQEQEAAKVIDAAAVVAGDVQEVVNEVSAADEAVSTVNEIAEEAAATVEESEAQGTPITIDEAVDAVAEDIENEPTVDELAAIEAEEGFTEADLQADMEADQQAAIDAQGAPQTPIQAPQRPENLPEYKGKEVKRASDFEYAFQQESRKGPVPLSALFARLQNWTEKEFNSQIKKWVGEGRLVLDDGGYVTTSFVESVPEATLTPINTAEPVRPNSLIAVREIDEAGLKAILNDGFSVAPSIGVVRVDNARTDFGDITIVYGASTIDPAQSPDNVIFKGDGWTPNAMRGPFSETRTPESELAKLKNQAKRDTANRERTGVPPRPTVESMEALGARRDGGPDGIGMGSNASARYDESKPYRIVQNSEIKGIIYPSYISNNVKAAIKASSIPSVEYQAQPGSNEGLKTAVQSFVTAQNNESNKLFFLRNPGAAEAQAQTQEQNPNEQALIAGERVITAETNEQVAASLQAGLDNAYRMAQNGVDMETIYQTTGWYMGSDYAWRFELMDDLSKIGILASNGKRALPKKRSLDISLADLYDNPRLFALYPELANINVSFIHFSNKNDLGYYAPQDNEMVLSLDATTTEQIEAFIHEVQHAVQHLEGFTGGTEPSAFVAKRGPNGEVITEFDQYWQAAGEVEARDAAARSIERYLAKVRGQEIKQSMPDTSGTVIMPSISLNGVNIPLSHPLGQQRAFSLASQALAPQPAGISFKAEQISDEMVRLNSNTGLHYDVVYNGVSWEVTSMSEILGNIPDAKFASKDEAIKHVAQIIKSNMIAVNKAYSLPGMRTVEGRWKMLLDLQMKSPNDFTQTDILAYQDWWRNFSETNPMTWGLSPSDTLAQIQRLAFLEQFEEGDPSTWTQPGMEALKAEYEALNDEIDAIYEEAEGTKTELTEAQQRQYDAANKAFDLIYDKYKDGHVWPPVKWQGNDKQLIDELSRKIRDFDAIIMSTYTLGLNAERANNLDKQLLALSKDAIKIFNQYDKAAEKEFNRLVGKFSQKFENWTPNVELPAHVQDFLDEFSPGDSATWTRHEFDAVKKDYVEAEKGLAATTDPAEQERYEELLGELEDKASDIAMQIQQAAEVAANEKKNSGKRAKADKKNGINENIQMLNAGNKRFFIPKYNRPVKVGQRTIPILEIKRAILSLAPLRQGRLPKGALGIYKVRESIMRIRSANDFEAAMHEIGHYLEAQFNLLNGITNTSPIYAELMAMGSITSPATYTEADILAEGTAQFFLQYAMDKEQARTLYPNYSHQFEAALNDKSRKEMSAKVKRIADLMEGYYQESDAQKMMSHVAPINGLPDMRSRAERAKSFIDRNYERFIDRYNALKIIDREFLEIANKQREAKGLKPWTMNPDDFNAYGKAVLSESHKASIDLHNGRILKLLKQNGLKTEADFTTLDQAFVAEHSIEYLMYQRIPGTGFSEISRFQGILNETPQKYKDVAKGIRQIYQEALYEAAVKGGLMTQETYDFFQKKFPNYVPFIRVDTQAAYDTDLDNYFTGANQGFVNTAEIWTKAKGMPNEDASMSVQSPTAALMENIGKFFAARARNEVGQALANMEAEFGNMGWLMEQIVPQKPGATITAKGDTIVHVWKDGVKKFYAVDPHIGNALLMVGERGKQSDLDAAIQIAGAMTPYIRFGATVGNLPFILSNIMGDAGNTWLQSKKWTLPGQHFFKGLFVQLAAKVPWKGQQRFLDIMDSARAAGVMRAGIVEHDASIQGIRDDINYAFGMGNYARLGANPRTWDSQRRRAFHWLINNLQAMVSTTEVAPKIAEFMYLRKMYGDEYITQAALDATKVNTNFNIRGRVGQHWNRIIPFFNAGIQGVVNANTTIRDNPYRSMFKVMIYGLTWGLGSAVSFLGSDDEEKRKEYARIRRADKDRSYYINFGGTENFMFKKPQGPWNFMLNTIERLIALAYAEDPHSLDGLRANFFNSYLPNLAPSFTFVAELISGRNFYTGRDIVPARLQGYESRDQYDDNTSLIARMVGEYTGASPMYLDYIARAGLAGVGTTAMHSLDWLDGSTPPAQPGTRNILIDRFFGNPVIDGSAPEDWLYDAYADARRAYNSYELRSSQGQFIDPSKDVLMYKDLEASVKELKEIDNEIKEYETFEDFGTPEERQQAIYELRTRRIEVAEEARKLYDSVDEFK